MFAMTDLKYFSMIFFCLPTLLFILFQVYQEDVKLKKFWAQNIQNSGILQKTNLKIIGN